MASAACGVLCAALPAPDTLLCVLRSVAGWFPGGEAGACAPQAAVEVAAFTARTLLLAGDFACAFAALTSDFPVAAVAGPVIDRSSAYQFHRALLGWVSGRRHVVPADGRFVHRTAQEIDRASVKAFPLCTGLHAPDDLSLQDGMPGDRSRACQIHCQGLPSSLDFFLYCLEDVVVAQHPFPPAFVCGRLTILSLRGSGRRTGEYPTAVRSVVGSQESYRKGRHCRARLYGAKACAPGVETG